MDEINNDDDNVDYDGDDGDALYGPVSPQSSTASSYLDALPRELVSLVAVHVARSDTNALDSLVSVLAHARQSIAATRIPLPWFAKRTTAPLDRASQLAKALGARGIDDIADRARRCVISAYIDWIAASAPTNVPDAMMAAAALVATAESARDLGHLCRLMVEPMEMCHRGIFADGIPISGLGAHLPPSLQFCSVRSICRLESSVLCRALDKHMAVCDGALDGQYLRRWMDDAIDTVAKNRCPGAFVVAPEMMPRFSDLFAIDGARVATMGADDDGFCLAGRLRPLW
ncbi:hypothetical protein pmac_cds_411 [Pandoravirus macleodensis]|uniref:F-box incomplete domain containing protein n=1 Tax=Pandoravirus macleodensis TaxID=2107707 RepID=A0A2U7UF48_9VIRU|nr:hypothetical protein pmac_cds_411 [Pandoravirus macleodensis]AVK77099.1 hypothetical protein pmac_cds_411 [Pandoravirus macleodensis]UMO79806.1 hypothetical protein [Pandoravirus aubagnensis]